MSVCSLPDELHSRAPSQSTRAIARRLIVASDSRRRELWGRMLMRCRTRLQVAIRHRMGPVLRRRYSVEDVFQEVGDRVLKRDESFVDATQPYAWLLAVTSRVICELARHATVRLVEKRWSEVRPGAQGSTAVIGMEARVPGRQPTPSVVAERRETSARIAELLERLSPEYREIIVERTFEGRDYVQIAGRLGITVAAARQRFSRARTRLREVNASMS